MSSLGFMTVALGSKYEQFVGPYIASTLTTYPEATCEIRVMTPDRFKASHKALLLRLHKVFGDRFLLAGVGFDWHRRRLIPNTVRFVIEPLLAKPAMLYIGDVDIVVSATGIQEFHADAMQQLKLPYSNVIRRGKQRLTGLHVVRTCDYYAVLTAKVRDKCIKRWPSFNDERFLYCMCKQYFGLPKIRTERPVYGIHSSLQRPLFQTGGCHWGVEAHLQTHLALVQSEQWRAVAPLFAAEFRQKMAQVRNWIEKQGLSNAGTRGAD